jgi:hypothetical protein
MKIIITIDEGNDAFVKNKGETARILREFVRNFEYYRDGRRLKLMDINGNSVGEVVIKGRS